MLQLIDRQKTKPYLQIFTIYLRYLIGGAFVIAAIGMGKLSGDVNILEAKSAPIQDLNSIQQFFRVMMDSGLYWKFIGWSQILVGALLMTQRFAKLGAVAFFSIILNIFIITISYPFKGTPQVTFLLLLAGTYLLVWDIRTFLVLITDKFEYKDQTFPIISNNYWSYLGIIMFASIVVAMLTVKSLLLYLGIPFMIGLIGFIIYFSYVIKKVAR